MLQRRFGVIALLAALGLVVTCVTSAAAAGITRSDGNDAKGPLDLASVRVTHTSTQDVIQIRALARVTPSQLNGTTGWFEVDLSTDSDKAYERWIVIFYNGARPIGVLGHADVSDYTLQAKRVDKRTLEVFVPYKHLGGIKGYDFAAASVWRAAPCSRSKPCVDSIPNRYPLLRSDFTAPTVTWSPKPPQISTDDSDTGGYTAKFSIADDPRGSGVGHWIVERQKAAGGWTTIAKGSTASGSVNVVGTAGKETTIRVRAWDKQGNAVSSKPATTFVPLDDRDPSLVYTTGAPVLHDGVSGAYLGTTSGLATATITATFPDYVGRRVCVVGGPSSTNTAMQIYFDGNFQTIAWEYTTTPARTSWCTNYYLPAATTVVTFVVNGSDEWTLDGVAFTK